MQNNEEKIKTLNTLLENNEKMRAQKRKENLWQTTRWQSVPKESQFVTESGQRERLRDDRRSELGESCYEGTIGETRERNN